METTLFAMGAAAGLFGVLVGLTVAGLVTWGTWYNQNMMRYDDFWRRFNVAFLAIGAFTGGALAALLAFYL